MKTKTIKCLSWFDSLWIAKEYRRNGHRTKVVEDADGWCVVLNPPDPRRSFWGLPS